jgi:hypothetical protein
MRATPLLGDEGSRARPTGNENDLRFKFCQNAVKVLRKFFDANIPAAAISYQGAGLERHGLRFPDPTVLGTMVADLDGKKITGAAGGAQASPMVRPKIIENDGNFL